MQLARTAAPPPNLQVAVVTSTKLPADAGLEEMFLDVYRRIHDRAMDHAERFLSKGESEDAFADAIAKIWYAWGTLTPEQRSNAYFFGAVHHEVLKRLTKNATLVDLEDAEAELTQLAIKEIDTPSRFITADEVIDVVVASMPPRRRAVFALIREQRFTYEEAASALHVSMGTVNTHMRLAADSLRAALNKHGFRIGGNLPPQLPPETPDGSNE